MVVRVVSAAHQQAVAAAGPLLLPLVRELPAVAVHPREAQAVLPLLAAVMGEMAAVP